MMQNIMNSTRSDNMTTRYIGVNINTTVGQSIVGITKYCDRANCQKEVLYNKLVTGGNDPSITKRELCSKRIGKYYR
jgi:hypothetical protein